MQAQERTGPASRSEVAAAKRAAEEREAELRRVMREGEAKLRERIARLDEDNQELRRCAPHSPFSSLGLGFARGQTRAGHSSF